MTNALIKKFVPSLLLDVRKQAMTFANLAQRYGQFRTIRKKSCLDRDGAAIPWYTYPAIEYLSHIDFSNRKVLEYGSGNSTLWWAGRCEELVSVEGNSEWYEANRSAVEQSTKVKYLLKTSEKDYVRQDYLRTAGVVIIDGDYRSRCADYLIESHSDKSHQIAMAVFDNADWYPQTMRKLKESLRWLQVDFHGFGPINDYSWTTSIFINPAGPEMRYLRPLMSRCGLAENAIGNADDGARAK
jgi:hypothetical protein